MLHILHSGSKSLIKDTWLQILRAMVYGKISKKLRYIFNSFDYFTYFTFFAIEYFAFETGGRATKYFIKGNIYMIGKQTLVFSICQLNMLMEIILISLEK